MVGGDGPAPPHMTLRDVSLTRPPGATIVPERDPELLTHVPAVLYACRGDELWTGLEISPGIADLAQLPARRWVADPDAWLRLVHPDDRSRLLRGRIDAMSSGELDCTYRIQRPDGQTLWIQDEARCRDGRVFGLLRDVSKEHRASDVMIRLQTAMSDELEALRQHDAARNAFVRTFVHDVRSSLRQAKIVAASRDDRSGDDALRSVLDELYALVDDLLLVGEIEPEERIVRPQWVTLAAIARAAIKEAAAVEQTTVDDGVGEAILDPVIVRRVLVNLVGNAVRHNPPGTQIRVQMMRSGDNVAITVEDDGVGISDQDRDRIFQPYVHLSEDACGWGLGLSLVHQLVGLHGGRIWLDDVPGGGASFNVVLPQGAAGGDERERASGQGHGTAVPAREPRTAPRSRSGPR